MPYLTHIKERTILKLALIEHMISFLNKCADLHEQVMRINYLEDIENAIGLSLVDEEYCLVSTLTFLLATFKRAVCHVKEDIDFQGLKKRLGIVER